MFWGHFSGAVGFIWRQDQEDGKNCKENKAGRVPETIRS